MGALNRLFVVMSLMISTVTAVNAAVIYVPDDYEKIQWAVLNASAGDTIIVRDGTYYENIWVYQPLTIRSENGSQNTVIDSKWIGSVFTIEADNVTIEGFTIRNSGGSGAGVKTYRHDNLTIKNNKFSSF